VKDVKDVFSCLHPMSMDLTALRLIDVPEMKRETVVQRQAGEKSAGPYGSLGMVSLRC